MKIIVDSVKYDIPPEKYVDKSEAAEIRSGTDYRDYDEFLIFEAETVDEVLDMIDYNNFVVSLNPQQEDIDCDITIYDYYIE